MAVSYKRVQLEDETSIRSSGDEAPADMYRQLLPELPGPLSLSAYNPQMLPAHKGLARVPDGDHDTAIGRLLENSQSAACKFIFSIKNMTKHTLLRTKSKGGDSWPLSDIKKGECVAALYGNSYIIDLTAVFTSDDDEPGARSVTLYANWPKVGARSIGIFAGKATNTNPWYKVNVKKVHDHAAHGNTATICSRSDYYIFQYNIKELDYAQYAVEANEDADKKVVDDFARFRRERLPDFIFVINNRTEYDLTLEDRVQVQGRWPLRDIKRNECAVSGFDGVNMSVAAHYSVRGEENQQKSISFAGSWPVMGFRKVCICRGRDAKHAWSNMSPHRDDDDTNQAFIREDKERGKVKIYVYMIKTLENKRVQ